MYGFNPLGWSRKSEWAGWQTFQIGLGNCFLTVLVNSAEQCRAVRSRVQCNVLPPLMLALHSLSQEEVVSLLAEAVSLQPLAQGFVTDGTVQYSTVQYSTVQ